MGGEKYAPKIFIGHRRVNVGAMSGE